MKITSTQFRSQATTFDHRGEVSEPGEGYDIKTLQRIALYDGEVQVEVVEVTIVNARGESGRVFLPADELQTALARLLAPGTGVTRLVVSAR